MKTLAAILLLLLPVRMISQTPKPLRMELEVKNSEDNYNVISLEKEGMLLYHQTLNHQTNFKIWTFERYDTLFNKKWNDDIMIPKNLEFIKYDFDRDIDKVYLLFLKTKRYYVSNYNTNNKGDFVIITLEINKGEFKTVKGSIEDKINLTEFKVIGNKAFIGGNSRPANSLVYLSALTNLTLIPMFTGLKFYKFKPEILCIDLDKNNINVIKPEFKHNSYLLNEQSFEADNKTELTAIIKNVVKRKASFLYFNKYNKDGAQAGSDNLLIPSDSTIVTAKINDIGNENILYGTYSKIKRHRLKYSPLYNAISELYLPSDGVYFSKYTSAKPDYIKFYSFKSMMNFSSQSIENEKFKLIGKKRIFDSDYRYILHDIVKQKNEYILLIEAYFPEFHLEYFWTTDMRGRSYQESREVFDGFRYSNAIIVSFDNKGKKLWDNSFEMWDILTYNLKERVKLMFDGDNIVLSYSNEGKIKSKIINRDKVIQPKEETLIDFSQDKKTGSSYMTSDMEHWYKNYFINFGYERREDKNNRNIKNQNRKTFFYINKIAFQ